MSPFEEVRRFVARMPPADSTIGLVCYPRSFSALRDQRAEILPVQRPPALAVGGRCMTRLTRILMFPFFFSRHHGSAPPTSRCLPKCPENFLGNLSWRIYVPTRPAHLVYIYSWIARGLGDCTNRTRKISDKKRLMVSVEYF